jgi:hypothetical protein
VPHLTIDGLPDRLSNRMIISQIYVRLPISIHYVLIRMPLPGFYGLLDQQSVAILQVDSCPVVLLTIHEISSCLPIVFPKFARTRVLSRL